MSIKKSIPKFEDQYLKEQDPFLLNEQRYLTRMQRALNTQEDRFNHHVNVVFVPEKEKKKQEDAK